MGTRVTTEGLSGTARCKGQAAHGARDKGDPVKGDQFWREMVWRERRAAREWEEKWESIKEFYQTGLVKPEEPLPNYVSLFSDHVPNTANQIVGSRLCTPLGRELVRLDSLILWPAGQRKRPRADALLGHSGHSNRTAETSTKELESKNKVA